MAETPSKLRYPTGSDLFQPHVDIERLARSATVIVPVANRAEADLIVADYQPTAARPLYVDRADNGHLERHRGNGWETVSRGRVPVTGQTTLQFDSNGNTTLTYGDIGFIPSAVMVTPVVSSSFAQAPVVMVRSDGLPDDSRVILRARNGVTGGAWSAALPVMWTAIP